MSDYVAWAGFVIAVVAGAAAVVSARHAKRSADIADKALLASTRPFLVPAPSWSAAAKSDGPYFTQLEGRRFEKVQYGGAQGSVVVQPINDLCHYSILVHNVGPGPAVLTGIRLLDHANGRRLVHTELARPGLHVAASGDAFRVAFIDSAPGQPLHKRACFDLVYHNIDGSRWFRSLIEVDGGQQRPARPRVVGTTVGELRKAPADMGDYSKHPTAPPIAQRKDDQPSNQKPEASA